MAGADPVLIRLRRIVKTLDDDALVLDDVLLFVERDDVRDAERLARDDQEIAGLDGYVRDRRISDDHFADRARQSEKLGLVVAHDEVARERRRCWSGREPEGDQGARDRHGGPGSRQMGGCGLDGHGSSLCFAFRRPLRPKNVNELQTSILFRHAASLAFGPPGLECARRGRRRLPVARTGADFLEDVRVLSGGFVAVSADASQIDWPELGMN